MRLCCSHLASVFCWFRDLFQLAIVVVGFPATPLLLARVRFCISAGHTREQLDYALWQLEDITDMMGCKYMKSECW
jgi:serine palmitoyltransferase